MKQKHEDVSVARAIEICLSKLVLDRETARVLRLQLESARDLERRKLLDFYDLTEDQFKMSQKNV